MAKRRDARGSERDDERNTLSFVHRRSRRPFVFYVYLCISSLEKRGDLYKVCTASLCHKEKVPTDDSNDNKTRQNTSMKKKHTIFGDAVQGPARLLGDRAGPIAARYRPQRDHTAQGVAPS